MAVNVVCTGCLKRLKFKDSESGLNRPCPKCGKAITVPGEPLPVEDRPLPGSDRTPGGSRRTETVIAAILLVVGVVGAIWFLKWRQAHREDSSSVTSTSAVPTPRRQSTPAPTTPTPPGPPANLPEVLTEGQTLTLGPATVKVVSAATVKETTVFGRTAPTGQKLARVTVDLAGIKSGPSFDSEKLRILAPDGKTYGPIAISGVDLAGQAYEVTRKLVGSLDLTAGSMTLEFFFLIPGDLEYKTCRLIYP